MLFEILTTSLMGGIAATAFMKKKGIVTNDSGKIQRIMTLSGLNVKDGKETLTTQLISANEYEWGHEYKYRIPLGRSFNDYANKLDVLQDGLNNRRKRIKLNDLKSVDWDKNVLLQLKNLMGSKFTETKEIELDYDGLLIIRVYDTPLPKKIDYIEGKEWKVPVGITRKQNEYKFHDFELIPHFVLGGATRYGKSNLINCMIVSLVQSEPENVNFYLVDLKGGVELSDYENIKQTISIAYELEETLHTLQHAYEKMKNIQNQLRATGKKNVQQANIKERFFVIIDEVGELNPNEAITKEEKQIKLQCQAYMSQIARLGAGLGFRLILASQYLVGDVLPRQVKQNADAKLCFRVQSATASRVILDESGAELLPQIKGRAVYQTADKREIVQTPLISTSEIKEVIDLHFVEKERKQHEEVTHETRRKPLVTLEEV